MCANRSLWESWTSMLVPRIAGEYVTAYRPTGDRYAGPDTEELAAGEWYDEWVPNDHGFAVAPDGRWHVFGITHPLTSPARVHDGENQSFHAIAPAGPLNETLTDGAWQDLPKILTAPERPDEIPAQHAPYIVRRDSTYYMFYGPHDIRVATSTDLITWTPRGPVFEGGPTARDPNVLLIGDTYHMVYCKEDAVESRTSADLVTWSGPRTILEMPGGIAPESPSLIAHDDTFYLFACGWDGDWGFSTVEGAYQHRTWVYQSSDPTSFSREITCLEAHAPEIIRAEDGRWYISSVVWPARGVSIAVLAWD